MTSRVGRVAVRLKLAAADSDRADETRRTVERAVIQQALDELERVVHERLGEAVIVHVHRLAFRWRLERSELDGPDAGLAIGRELAAMILDELEATPKPQRLRPVDAANIVMFADADHALAAAIADAAEQRKAWFHAQYPDPAREWAERVVVSRERTAAVTGWFARMDVTAPVAVWLGERMPDLHAPTVAVISSQAGERAAARGDVALAPSIIDAHVVAETAVTHETATPGQGPVTAAVVDAAEPTTSLEPAGARVHTDFAAMFYLAQLVQQLDLGEQLWMIGVREGDVLAHVAGAIAGCDLDDPAWQWFGGGFDGALALAPMDEWAVAELGANLANTLARELGRMGIVPRETQLPLRPLVATDARTAGAVVRCADALCQLWCARVGIAVELAAVRAALRVRGTLELAPGVLRVTLPMQAIDIAIRRAGLDLDPGHLPWLGRAVEIVYEADPRTSNS